MLSRVFATCKSARSKACTVRKPRAEPHTIASPSGPFAAPSLKHHHFNTRGTAKSLAENMATGTSDSPASPDLIGGKPRPANLPAFFADSKDSVDFEAHWDKLWKEHWTPWDRGGPSMALCDVVCDNPDVFCPPHTGKKALVPGCGRGHDVLLLASLGYDAYGLDLSPAAALAAKANEMKNGSLEVYKTKGPKHGKITWLTGDFFSYGLKDIGPFDLIFDYPFLCALPFDLRPKWSKAMRDNLAPTGKLVCLEFPTTKPTSTPGPPFGLPEPLYGALLGRPGEDIPYDDDKAVKVSSLGPESPDGLVQVTRITPKRTHNDGYDGNSNVLDRVSVWGPRKP